MSANTKIAWCHSTFNPWWGCHKVSPACTNCYAEAFSKRTGHAVWGLKAPRRFFGEKHWAEPLKWNRDAEKAGERRRVFCGSMMDVLEIHPDDAVLEKQSAARGELEYLIAATPWLDWLLLTKRPENFAECFPRWSAGCPDNVWAGATVENQEYAGLRIPHLLKIQARVRFLSCEPLLGSIDLRVLRTGDFDSLDALTGVRSYTGRGAGVGHEVQQFRAGIDWVIAGGESGHHHREHRLEWSRSLRDQCAAAGVAYFFKQLGEDPTEAITSEALLSIHRERGIRERLRLELAPRSKGEGLEEVPIDLRVREFPTPDPAATGGGGK